MEAEQTVIRDDGLTTEVFSSTADVAIMWKGNDIIHITGPVDGTFTIFVFGDGRPVTIQVTPKEGH